MHKTWLIIDGDNCAWRNFYAMGGLSYGGEPTGAIFGFFRDILDLQDTFCTPNIAFCFDSGPSLRTQLLPDYKSSRRTRERILPREQKRALKGLRSQLDKLCWEHLPAIGFKNVFCEKGYEADDLIASLVRDIEDYIIIVSTDHDLYQLLDDRVIVYDQRKKKAISRKSFIEHYGVDPYTWDLVKAITGDTTDDIPGIRGIGVKTACKYVAGKLPEKDKRFAIIEKDLNAIKQRTILTRIPFRGTPSFRLEKDNVSCEKWRKVLGKLGMDSLLRRVPPS